MKLNKDDLKPILEVMLEGQALHEESWDKTRSQYTKTSEQCHVEACGGDKDVGYLLYLFSHWQNDVETMAKECFGVHPRALRESEESESQA